MNINIKLLSGKLINVHVEKTDTIYQIKQKSQEMEGIGYEQQQLVFNGSILKNELKISEIKIDPHSIFYMILSLRNGKTMADFRS